jgi:hypothetical protein
MVQPLPLANPSHSRYVHLGMDRNGGSKDEGGTGETAADRLRLAVNATTAGAGSRDEVQAAARALVAELRGRQEAPEQVLIEMKALLADAGLRAGYPPSSLEKSQGMHVSLYRDIITWAIRCYYEDGTN